MFLSSLEARGVRCGFPDKTTVRHDAPCLGRESGTGHRDRPSRANPRRLAVRHPDAQSCSYNGERSPGTTATPHISRTMRPA